MKEGYCTARVMVGNEKKLENKENYDEDEEEDEEEEREDVVCSVELYREKDVNRCLSGDEKKAEGRRGKAGREKKRGARGEMSRRAVDSRHFSSLTFPHLMVSRASELPSPSRLLTHFLPSIASSISPPACSSI
ncbi:hypothetical protein E2C01_068338 [Portunus trituberculatus]|uniref:Uncharacterized protein n=1 Tax=Portunus trituberculatus TaxID=210409 RepID=A0A5B7HZS1_PORTR|nr:hypothetical protein [Portunus trituberculatus]